jgi:hypothetical protein
MIGVMGDWEQFLHEASWFSRRAENVAVVAARPWTRGSVDDLPQLSALLATATLTPISVGGAAYELLAWGSPDDRRGWLCHPPPLAVDGHCVAQIHQSFWKLCGGIVEWFGEPATWWNNQYEVLTVSATREGVAEALAAYEWIWRDDGLEIPIDPDEYYAAAVEANGNLTLAHRDDGRLLLFAPDHDFTGVTPLAGCPPQSLLTIDDVPDLGTWVEVCAAAWRGH